MRVPCGKNLMRELDERLGLSAPVEPHLTDPRARIFICLSANAGNTGL